MAEICDFVFNLSRLRVMETLFWSDYQHYCPFMSVFLMGHFKNLSYFSDKFRPFI